MSMAAILFNCAKAFEQIVSTISKEGPHMKSGEKWQEVSENKTFKVLYYFLHAQGQIKFGL